MYFYLKIFILISKVPKPVIFFLKFSRNYGILWRIIHLRKGIYFTEEETNAEDTMFVYSLVVMGILIISSAILAYILKKNKLLDLRVFFALVASSVAVSLLFPLIFGALSTYGGFVAAEQGIYLSFFIAFVIYVTLIFLLSIAISLMISDRKLVQITEGIRNVFSARADDKKNILEKSVDTGEITDKMGLEAYGGEECNAAAGDMEYDPDVQADEIPDADINENPGVFDIECEMQAYCTDTEESDETGYEAEGIDLSVDLSLNECVDEAFRLKEQGDFEGAILYYMYALDRKPEKDLVFWIILDICVLYKAMGRVDLAREILESYVNNYGSVMNETVKSEIERNLLYI